MNIVIIKEKFQDDFTTRIAGEKLRQMILDSNSGVVLDFEGVKIASAAFFDEGIAKLSLEGWDSKRLKEKVTFLNMFKRDYELLISVCSVRGINL